MSSDCISGRRAYSRALSLIGQLRLWNYLAIPALLGLLLAFGTGGLAWEYSTQLGDWFLSFTPDWGGSFLEGLSQVLSAVLILALGIMLFKHLLLVVVSPFMSPLSERVERYLKGDTTPPPPFSPSRFAGDLIRGLRIALRNVFWELLFSLPFFLLSLLPGIGLLGAVGLFLVQAYYAGFGSIDYTLERHFRVRDSVRFVRQNRGLALGNGSVFVLLLSTGIGILIAPPLATIAATIETIERLPQKPVPETSAFEYI